MTERLDYVDITVVIYNFVYDWISFGVHSGTGGRIDGVSARSPQLFFEDIFGFSSKSELKYNYILLFITYLFIT